MKRVTTYWAALAAIVIGLSACSNQRYAVSPSYEDDDLYFAPDRSFVDEQSASAAYIDDQNFEGEFDEYADDYYDPNRFTPSQGHPNIYDPSFHNPHMDFRTRGGFAIHNGWGMGRPRFGPGCGMSMGLGNSMWHPMGMGGFGMPMNAWGMNPMLPSGYFYGHSAFGSPMWSPGFGGGWHDPFWGSSMGWGGGMGMGMGMGGNPWMGGFGNPWMGGFGNPWMGGFGNPWAGGWIGDQGGSGNSTVYGPRSPISTGTPSGGSSYGDGSTVTTPRQTHINDQGGFPMPGGRPMDTTSPAETGRNVLTTPDVRPNTTGMRDGRTPQRGGNTTTPQRGSGNDIDYFRPASPATPQRPTGNPNVNTPSRGNQPAATPSQPNRNVSPSRSNNRGGSFGGNRNSTPRSSGGSFGGSSTPRSSGGSFGGSRNSTPRSSGGSFGGGSTPRSSGGSFGGSSTPRSSGGGGSRGGSRPR